MKRLIAAKTGEGQRTHDQLTVTDARLASALHELVAHENSLTKAEREKARSRVLSCAWCSGKKFGDYVEYVAYMCFGASGRVRGGI